MEADASVVTPLLVAVVGIAYQHNHLKQHGNDIVLEHILDFERMVRRLP